MPSISDLPKVSNIRTIRIFLVGVGHQAAIVRAGRHVVGDPVVVVIVVAFVPQAVVVGIQLGAVGDLRAVVFGVLMTVPVAGQDRKRQSE